MSHSRMFRVFTPLMLLLVALIPASVGAADTLMPQQVPGGTLMAPPGFTVTVFATGLGSPRFAAVRPADGMLFVADARGNVYTVSDNGTTQLFVGDLQSPSSLAFHGDYLYVGETNEIVRFHLTGNALTPDGPKEVIVPDLPANGYHWTRTVAFGPDDKMYVSVGSSCDDCIEPDSRRGAISIYDPDGTNGRFYATGVRNAVGLVWQPGTTQMWATINENDAEGKDDFRMINDGVFYGWPLCNRTTPNPQYPDAPARCATVPPDAISLEDHCAPLGITFGERFAAPQRYKDSLYIAEHGSYDGTTGYKIVRVPMVDGAPGQPEDFIVGWQGGGRQWGRPVGVTVGNDGALYVTDDSTGTLYRVAASQ